MSFRKELNRILWRVGYRLEKVRFFERELNKLLIKKPGFRFVQVGANDGIRFDSLYDFVTKNNLSGLVIEPLPDVFKQLQFNYSFYQKIVPLNVAVHTNATKMKMYRVSSGYHGVLPEWVYGIGSFSKDHLSVRNSLPDDAIVEEIVHCAPLMQLVEEHQLLGAELLQVDTEGFDAQVIKMVDFDRWKPALIKFEWANLSQDDRDETEFLLKNRDYKLREQGLDMVAVLI